MANFNFNRAVIAGRLTKNVDASSTAPFSVEVSRRFREGTFDIIPVIPANDKVLEAIKQGINGALSVYIEGVIRVTPFENNGMKLTRTEIVAESVNFVPESTGFNINKVVVAGKLTRDVEVKTAGQMNIATFSVATNRKSKDEPADFIRITAFGKTADMVSKYFHKGSSICVEGSVKVDCVEKNGHINVYTNVAADRICFVDGVSDNGQKGYTVKTHTKSNNQEFKTPYNSPVQNTPTTEPASEDEMPF